MNPTKFNSLLRVLYDYFTKKWFVTSLIIVVSSNWFFVLRTFGQYWNIIDNSNKLTPKFHLLFWPVFGFSLIFTMLKTWADKYNQKIVDNGQFVLNSLLDNINASKDCKLRRFSEFIEDNQNYKVPNPFHKITQPRLQIEDLLDNFRGTLSTIFGINKSNIGISIIYSINNSDWDWLCTMNVSNDIPLRDLISNSSSTVNQLVNSHSKYIFYPDKRIGIGERKYLPSNTDKTNDNIGSIICKEIWIGRDNRYLRAILSITSYGLQFCNEKDKNAIYKIENIVLPTFERRLKLEFSLLYIKEVIAVEN